MSRKITQLAYLKTLYKSKNLYDANHIFYTMKTLYVTKKVQVLIDNIRYLQADINYTTIFTCQKENIISTTTIKRLNDKLDSDNFIRINKKIIINRVFIRNYSFDNNKIILDNGEIFSLSRRKNRALRDILEIH
ncbi:hypothetical protein EWM59_16725 [Emticicia agri]|uniref:HTH LytTR-type domain-containing protein n=2 Tax=Emticicia agri TaxID=2492393 RepID=A0A4Q5LY42_9BACT|nr:hypothetical protein EWM59_16725 [Emticicia agri]